MSSPSDNKQFMIMSLSATWLNNIEKLKVDLQTAHKHKVDQTTDLWKPILDSYTDQIKWLNETKTLSDEEKLKQLTALYQNFIAIGSTTKFNLAFPGPFLKTEPREEIEKYNQAHNVCCEKVAEFQKKLSESLDANGPKKSFWNKLAGAISGFFAGLVYGPAVSLIDDQRKTKMQEQYFDHLSKSKVNEDEKLVSSLIDPRDENVRMGKAGIGFLKILFYPVTAVVKAISSAISGWKKGFPESLKSDLGNRDVEISLHEKMQTPEPIEETEMLPVPETPEPEPIPEGSERAPILPKPIPEGPEPAPILPKPIPTPEEEEHIPMSDMRSVVEKPRQLKTRGFLHGEDGHPTLDEDLYQQASEHYGSSRKSPPPSDEARAAWGAPAPAEKGGAAEKQTEHTERSPSPRQHT